MLKHPTILQQFRSFCFQNNATHLETAIEYFAVFGGMGWRVDMSKPLDELIEEKVLKNYRYIHGDITKTTNSILYGTDTYNVPLCQDHLKSLPYS